MYIYLIASNPLHEYDDCHDGVVLTHWLYFENEEFKNQCVEAAQNIKEKYPTSNAIAKYLIEYHGYKEAEYQGFFDMNLLDK